MITFERLKAEYIDQVYTICEKSFPIPWSKDSIKNELEKDNSCFIVAKSDDAITGFIVCWFVMDECHIGNIAVDPGFRNQGIGKALVNEVFKEANKKNTKYFLLEVRLSNTIAQALYKEFGFEEVATRKHYYKNEDGTYEDALLMSKSI
jgi:ribosomal-protein-alanine N-acetyltransferase